MMRKAALFEKEETDSTQSDARRLIGTGQAFHGDICTALYQNAGRGRIAGRIWKGEKGAALMFTLILEKKKTPQPPPLSLVAGLAEALVFEKEFALRPKIKWPNDVYLEGKKCGGILCESEKAFWLCGMGINLNQTAFSGELTDKAVSLRIILGEPIDRMSVLNSLAREIHRVLKLPAGEILAEIDKRLLWKGEERTMLMGDPGNEEELVGIVEGLADDGALLVKADGEVKPVYSAEFK